VIQSRWNLTRFYLSGRSQGWDYRDSLHYALHRSGQFLINSFNRKELA
jgi:hypothetical protein